MKTFSRRDVLKTSLLAPAAVAAAHGMGPMGAAIETAEPAEPLFAPAPGDEDGKAMKSAGRERLLLDFGWRFHFGHANDPIKDFGFGAMTGNFQKTGNFMPAASMAFDDGAMERRESAPRLGRGTAVSERSGPAKQGLLPARPQLSGHQRGLVSPGLRFAGRGCGKADHD